MWLLWESSEPGRAQGLTRTVVLVWRVREARGWAREHWPRPNQQGLGASGVLERGLKGRA